ncbi:family 2A encapsulin nanocompartment cargo protein cysteine desulfurase [Heliophilum fasciatum]|uniref:Cysteine desulfurase n=1 Tax=Heliophilum fasciatum TaxID=35700 RepID=A0A4R2RJH2_9FIRM|nr:family 2A encapsulin nanocompartment cargo protein cysteine desulfurase [Heliophilum fasciatum]MCW2278209.1 cysteine desulfurase/selenocysteine lyase [Heliophilum fasciatum]TCP63970.1 cysteine desulfurase/selenocysteine lyase [Heliophilum fasciatum]
MTINSLHDLVDFPVDPIVQLSQDAPVVANLLPEVSVIAAMIQEYFPEFQVPAKNGSPDPVLIAENDGEGGATNQDERKNLGPGEPTPLSLVPVKLTTLHPGNPNWSPLSMATTSPVAPAPVMSAPVVPASVVPAPHLRTDGFEVTLVRRDFPILAEKVNGKNLIWLDNAATTHKPQSVIDRISYFYAHENSNVHRGAHTLAARSTDAYEGARKKVAQFLNASSPQEIVFVRGTTEGINLVAHSWGRYHLQKDDEIVITWLEHHANMVPWQILCRETGANLRVVPVDETGQVRLDEYARILSPKAKLVALTHVSNALGTVTPVAEMAFMAHRHGAKVLVDGAQAVPHLKVDVQALDCDFYVFSGHKVFGPTGIGALYAKPEILDAMHPYQSGGNMIADVTLERSLYQPAPQRFEAGTGNIADAVGLGAALDYVMAIGMETIDRYEHRLLAYGMEMLRTINGLRLIGTAKEKASVLSFVIDGFTTEEIGQALSQEGIAVRAGHHCAQPILRRFGLESTVRPSLALYNTIDEIDAMVAVLKKLTLSQRTTRWS